MDRADLLQLWKKTLEKTKSGRTVITYLKSLQSFLRHVGEEDIIGVDPKKIYSYVDTSNLNTSSILTHLSAIKHFYKFAFRRGYVDREKYSQIESVIDEVREDVGRNLSQRYPKALSKEEVREILSAVSGTKYEKIYVLFLYSGIRLSEYLSLREDNFYQDKSGLLWIRLLPDMTKRKKERLVPVLGSTKEETYAVTDRLLAWIESYDENFRVKRGSLQVFTNRLSHRLGIPFSLHSFRHTYITNLVNSGFPAEVVKEFAGHSNVRTTIDIYYRFSHERARRLIENFLR
ncbi:tyrosine-type recombinase/integrase [Hydrogenobacter thermophilus]|uniref:tyrosine-type recombinase/integrase n=1 Tax=Hydrogenobacter thermophilus TaxID=940 RepID=UPI0030FCD71E